MQKKGKWIVVVGTSYALLVVLMTYPSARHLSDRLIGNNIDNWIFYWNNWWVQEAVRSGQSWFFTQAIFAPAGTSLIAHSHSLANSLAAISLTPITGPVAAYNLVVLAGLWLSALGMFWLVWDMTKRPGAAFLAGLIFAFAPYHMSKALAQANLASIQWWPFYILFLRRTLRDVRWQDVVAAAVFAALTLWSGLQLALLLGMWTAVYLLWFLTKQKTERGKRMVRVTAVALITTLFSLPILWPILKNLPALTALASAYDEGLNKQTDLLAYWIPPTTHPLWGRYLVPIYEKFVVNRAFTPYLGITAVALALYALWRRMAEVWFWGGSAWLWLLLAAGSALRINGVVYETIPLPYKWLGAIFPLSVIRSPDRFNLLVILSLAVLAGLGAAALEERVTAVKPNRLQKWPLIPLGLLILLEYALLPLPQWDLPPVSPFLAEAANDPAQYNVIDYPMGYTNAKLWLYYQTIHGKPTAEGHVSRYSPKTYETILTQPLLRTWYDQAEWPPLLKPDQVIRPENISLSASAQALQAMNFRYVFYHLPYASEAETAVFQETLPFLPVFQDESLAVYDFTRPRPWQYGEVITLDGVTLLAVVTQLGETAVSLQLVAQLDKLPTPVPCQIRLQDQFVTLTLFAGSPKWQPGDLDWLTAQLPLPDAPSPGRYPLEIKCGASQWQPLPDQLFIAESGQAALMRQPLNLVFGNQIALSGIRWQWAGTEMRVGLLWQSLADGLQEYKVFVHLLDDSGAVVRQYDALPCAWNCPTSQWQAGQWIEDEAILSFAGLPPGFYRLAIGLYDPATGERLPVLAGDTAVPDAYFILPQPITIQARQ